MFSRTSPETLLRIITSGTWILLAAWGVSAVLATPRPVELTLGDVALYSSGVFVIVASLAASLGVILNRYRWVWFASWLAAAAMVPYAITTWWLVLSGSLGMQWITQAMALTTLFGFVAVRAQTCSTQASRLRKITQTGPVDTDG